jgi:hypothetical protein
VEGVTEESPMRDDVEPLHVIVRMPGRTLHFNHAEGPPPDLSNLERHVARVMLKDAIRALKEMQ